MSNPVQFSLVLLQYPYRTQYTDGGFPNVMPTEVGISPQAQISNQRRVCTKVLFLHKAELGFFHFLEIVRAWLVPTARQKIPVQPGRYLPPQKNPLAGNRFLQAGKGTENRKDQNPGRAFRAHDHILLTPLSVYRQYRQFRISTQTRWALLPYTQG